MCPQCNGTLPTGSRPGFCAACLGQLRPDPDRPFHVRLVTPQPLDLFAWGEYDGPLKRAIAACKYSNRPQILRCLGQQIGRTWQTAAQTWQARHPGLTVVPIPLHPAKYKSRGFNQAEELARGFCQVTGLPCRPNLLQRVRETIPQMQTRSRAERIANLQEAFQAIAPPIPCCSATIFTPRGPPFKRRSEPAKPSKPRWPVWWCWPAPPPDPFGGENPFLGCMVSSPLMSTAPHPS
ncbi:MAG: ComF family protein [Oscillatoriales cyanobacterium SM2_1_8]|nr:ComF family protein [Oscillatoriales cyanobacterium SM2_1_8]